jgi:hypothetical protein
MELLVRVCRHLKAFKIDVTVVDPGNSEAEG